MADRAEMSSTDRASGMDENQSTTDSSSLCLVPRYKFVGIAGHQQSRQACLTNSDEAIETQVNDAKAATARALQVNVTLQFHMDSSVWDVIQKEVMDWRDSSWTSMHLPRDMMYFTLYLPSWNAKDPTETLDHDEPSRLIVAKMITVQLLASCFTSVQDINAVTLPSAWYRRQHRANDKGRERRLISSLRQHTQSKYSPAYGHHARNNSAVSSWPDQGHGVSREDCLAEQVSRKRYSRRRERRAVRKSVVAKVR